MEQILYDQNPHWAGERYDGFIARTVLPELLQLLKLEEILVLKGVRRCGKTTLFFHLINHLLENVDPQSIFYINLDDPYFTPLNEDATNLYQILQTAEKITGKHVQYLFLDEVQNMHQWEKFVKSTYDSKKFKKIFITGSNSALLESQYATLLSGRYVEQAIYPLSFKECLYNQNIKNKLSLIKEKPKVLAIFENLLYYGSFPKSYLEQDEKLKRKILTSYYNTILLKDCIAANNIRDGNLVSQLAHYLITNAGARYSYNSIANSLGSNEKTIKDYIHALENGLLIDEVKTFSHSLRKQARQNKKCYTVDNGLITAIGFQFELIHGKLFENLVYNELKKCGANEIFVYFDNKECDFIVKQGPTCIAIQVCHTLTGHSQKREVDGVKLAMAETRAKYGYIITYDQEQDIENNIFAIPFWKLFAFIDDVDQLFSVHA